MIENAPDPSPVEKVPHYKAIMNLYAAFGVSMILTIIPSIAVAVVSLFFVLGVMIAAYAMRGRDHENGLLHNHTTFIIRTIWIGSFYALITTTIGSIYMVQNLSYDSFIPCANTLVEKQISPDLANYEQVMREIEPCMPVFMEENKTPFRIAFAITSIPVLFFFFLRYFRGVFRAYKGYRLADVKSWL